MRKEWEWILWYDWALCPIYFYIIYLLFKNWGKKHYSGEMLKYYKNGIILKLIGGLGFAIYHQYIFHAGDTVLYFKTGRDIASLLFTNFNKFLSLTFLPTTSTTDIHIFVLDYIVYSEPNFFIARLAAILSIISLGAYIPTLFCFVAMSYLGIWYCFTSIIKVYPKLEKELAISFLYIPSVIFWGSGLGKDSITFGATCLLFGALVRLILLPKPKLITNLFYFFISGSLLLIIKPYIVYSFVLSFSIGIILQKLVLIKNMGLKIILFPLIFGIGIAVFWGIFVYINADKTLGLNYAAERVLANNKGLTTGEGVAGSTYDLGIDIENVESFTDILPLFPKSIFITLFRPFLWEVKNVSMLLSAMESVCVFLIFIYILYKKRVIGIFPILIRNPIAISCLLFTLVFAGFVGISSGNFGTLVRYKIPCIPFFCMLLAILYSGGTKKADDIQQHIV